MNLSGAYVLSQTPSLRVLMTVDGLCGVWTYAVELGAWLVARGVDVTFAAMGAELRSAQRQELRALGIRLEQTHFRLEWTQEPWADLQHARNWLLELERMYRPDVVHFNGFAPATTTLQAATVVVLHSSIPSWWRAVFGTEPAAEYAAYASAVTRGLRSATRIVTPSRTMLSAVAAHEPWLQRELAGASQTSVRGHARVIENGIALRPTTPAQNKERFVFSAGRLWDPAKNEQLLCEIAPYVPWPVRLAGELGSEDSPALRGVQHLGLLSRDQVFEQMRAAAIYAAPALYEPFGLSILEAAMSGCALVLSDIPSLRELWGEAAVFADPRDPAAWVAALRNLAADPAARTRLALVARARAQRYGVERMGNAYLDLYETLRAERERAGHRYGVA